MTARTFALPLLIALAACQTPPPESPTWFQDVQPLVMANCARCHGADPEQLAIAGFRLDRYVKLDSTTLDAYDYREAMVRSAALRNAPAMPPDYALTDRQRQLLERWVEIGAPKGQRDNHLPEVERVAPVESAAMVDQTLALTIRTWDADNDGLVVGVGVREVGSPQADAVTRTGGGLRQLTLDTSALASGRTYEVFAVLDDGYSDDPAANAHVVVVLPNVSVDHGARGTAPTVRLLQPNGGTALSGTTEIAWSASDPDPGDVVTIDLQLLEVAADGSATALSTIAAGLPNSPSTFAWDTAGVQPTRDGMPIRYKVRVVARDAGNLNERFDDSDTPFTILKVTTYTWADVRPVFLATCAGCHGEPPDRSVPSTYDNFRLDKYNASDPVPPVNGDLGVYEMRERVQARMVVQKTMPPAYATPKPTAAEIAMVADWINGGAPKGSQDAPPTFTWTVPNDAAVTAASTTGSVTLTWTAADPEGLAFQSGSIAYAPISAPTDTLAVCDASVTGWTAIPGVDIGAGTHAFTLPTTGYFCFRGQVTDAAGQTTTAIARKPVKR